MIITLFILIIAVILCELKKQLTDKPTAIWLSLDPAIDNVTTLKDNKDLIEMLESDPNLRYGVSWLKNSFAFDYAAPFRCGELVPLEPTTCSFAELIENSLFFLPKAQDQASSVSILNEVYCRVPDFIKLKVDVRVIVILTRSPCLICDPAKQSVYNAFSVEKALEMLKEGSTKLIIATTPENAEMYSKTFVPVYTGTVTVLQHDLKDIRQLFLSLVKLLQATSSTEIPPPNPTYPYPNNDLMNKDFPPVDPKFDIMIRDLYKFCGLKTLGPYPEKPSDATLEKEIFTVLGLCLTTLVLCFLGQFLIKYVYMPRRSVKKKVKEKQKKGKKTEETA